MWSPTFEPDARAMLLFQAFDEIDNSNDDTKLKVWFNTFHQKINDELILVDNVKDSHKGKKLENMGSPLYVAIVRDIPKAVKELLAHGADVNYVHPDHHGVRTGILHCVDRGYDLCLKELLASGINNNDDEDKEKGGGKRGRSIIDPSVHVTVYSKYLLGQGLPLYEEGGQNPLSIAMWRGRVEAFNILLSLCPKDWIDRWLKEKDAIGRNVYEVALDLMAVETTKCTPKYKSLHQIVCLLLRYKLQEEKEGNDERGENNQMEIEKRIKTSLPTSEDASQRQKERSRVVRQKCLQAEKQQWEGKAIKGMEAVQKYYKPLHPEVYDIHSIRNACKNITFSDSSSSNATGTIVQEPVKGVYTFPFLDAQFCDRLWAEIHHYEMKAAENPKMCLPLFVRHDGNLGDLQVCGFRKLLDALADACGSVLQHCLREYDGRNDKDPEKIEIYHAFLTRNYVGRESNATFKMHRDKSDLTLNICLHASNDFEGSTVGFYQHSTTKKDGASISSTDETPPNDDDRTYTHTHKVGVAVVHSGRSWHRTDPITKGTRGSLIAWARRQK